MLFGILALLTVGASWSLVGVVMSSGPKNGIEVPPIQLTNAFFAMVFSALIAVISGQMTSVELPVLLLGTGIYFVAGFLDCLGMRCLAEGMKRGPNGIVWAIMQSALVFPFLVGIFFFGVELTIFRGIGILLLLSALIFFGASQDNNQKDKLSGRGSWRFWAFLALALISVQQNLTATPSYYPALQEISPVVRALASITGCLVGALPGQVGKGFFKEFSGVIRRKCFWIYIGILQMISLPLAYFLMYPGLDAMANAGAGAISYPMMVGSCIIGFSLYSIVVLKEKVSKLQILGMLFCLGGLICLCFPA